MTLTKKRFEELKVYYSENPGYYPEYLQVIQTLESCIKELEFYGDKENYAITLITQSCGYCSYEVKAVILKDKGQRARDWLDKWEGK